MVSILAEAKAEVINGDSGFGPNTVAIDTITGLKWLDLTVTAGLSYNTVSQELGPPGRFSGYRYASQDDILQFFLDAGIPHPSPVDAFFTDNYQPVVDLLSVIGVLRPDPNFPQSEAVSSDPKDALTSDGFVPGHKVASLTVCLTAEELVCTPGSAAAFVGFGTPSWDDSIGVGLGTTVGQWLVGVPEPSALILFSTMLFVASVASAGVGDPRLILINRDMGRGKRRNPPPPSTARPASPRR
jgi:hypothetical protein